MRMSRRHIIAGATAAILLPEAIFGAARPKRDFFNQIIGTKGILPTNPADVALVPEVIKAIPTGDYVGAMLALASLDKNPNVPKGSTGEPWNRRWAQYANPLLVHIWREMGYPYKNDCEAWCAVTLGWCLKRGGKTVPANVEASQSYLTCGTPVTTPQRGDICVFTNNTKGGGHVTIFEAMVPGPKPLLVVGANQELSDPATNCPGNLGVNVVDERKMALKTGGHHLNQYRRPL